MFPQVHVLVLGSLVSVQRMGSVLPAPLTTHGPRSRFFALKNTLQFAERYKSYGWEVAGKYRRQMRNGWFVLQWSTSRRCGSCSQIYHWFGLWPWTSHFISFRLCFSSCSLALELISSPRRVGSALCSCGRICSYSSENQFVSWCDLCVGIAPHVAESRDPRVLGNKEWTSKKMQKHS